MKKIFIAIMLLLSFAQCASSDVFPAERVVRFPRGSVARRERYNLYFNCTGADREVKNISVTGVTTDRATVSHSVHQGTNGMGKYLELIPMGGPGTVRMTVTATGDSGRSNRTMIEIIVE